jgi:hypothetical protein
MLRILNPLPAALLLQGFEKILLVQFLEDFLVYELVRLSALGVRTGGCEVIHGNLNPRRKRIGRRSRLKKSRTVACQSSIEYKGFDARACPALFYAQLKSPGHGFVTRLWLLVSDHPNFRLLLIVWVESRESLRMHAVVRATASGRRGGNKHGH